MRGRHLATLTWLVLAAGVCAFPGTAAANSFFVRCAPTHVSNDDPIVFPGQRGAAHRHEFYGARGVDAVSTEQGLRGGATSCRERADSAAYWAPTLEVDGRRVRGTLFAYYERGGKPRAAAPPAGLQLLAGDPHATAPQPIRTTSWSCVGTRTSGVRELRTPPACRRGTRLAARIRFPDCWNGTDLDMPDHRAHVTYASRSGACPTTHPVAIMRLTMLVVWSARPAANAHLTLGGGALPTTGMHADFWNTWRQPRLAQLRWDCIEVATPCGEVPRRRH